MKAQRQIPAQNQKYMLRLNYCCLSDTNIKAYVKENPLLKRKKKKKEVEKKFWADKMTQLVYRQLNP